MTLMSKSETTTDSMATCPACGWQDPDSFESGDGMDYECPKCGASFVVESTEAVRYFTTRLTKKKAEGGEEAQE